MVWSSFAEWAMELFGMSRELKEHRLAIADLKERVRNLEEMLKLFAQQEQHREEVAALERDKFLLTIENEFARRDRSLTVPRGKKSK